MRHLGVQIRIRNMVASNVRDGKRRLRCWLGFNVIVAKFNPRDEFGGCWRHCKKMRSDS
jgi:hypothetical protein